MGCTGAGFATTQHAYEEAYHDAFALLDLLSGVWQAKSSCSAND